MQRWVCLFFISNVFFGTVALAQLDPLGSGLIRPSSTAGSESLEGSRYKIRQPEARRERAEVLDEKPTAPAKAEAPVEKAATTPPMSAPATVAPAPQVTAPIEESRQPVTLQVRDLILGGSQQDIEDYRKQIHPQDPRTNVLSITIAPAYYYNDSSSQYSFRRYNSNGPGLGLGMNLWLTPFFGLQSTYFASVSASQKNGTTNMVPTDIQTFDAGIRFRKYFGYSRKASSLSWGLDYHDSLNKISESTTSIGRKTYGLGLSLEAQVPTSVTYAHTFRVDIRPRLKHSETGNNLESRSGTKNETNAINLAVGGQWLLDRRNQIFWRGQYTVERNLFDGTATVADPHNGQTPDGVTVTNSLMMFYFGFKWGS